MPPKVAVLCAYQTKGRASMYFTACACSPSSACAAAGQRDMLIRDIIARMRHDGCGGRAGEGRWGQQPTGADDRAGDGPPAANELRVNDPAIADFQ